MGNIFGYDLNDKNDSNGLDDSDDSDDSDNKNHSDNSDNKNGSDNSDNKNGSDNSDNKNGSDNSDNKNGLDDSDNKNDSDNSDNKNGSDNSDNKNGSDDSDGSDNTTDDTWMVDSLTVYQEILQSQDVPVRGKIYIMYHGTTVQAAKGIIKHGFRQSEDGMLGPGVYVSRDKDKAAWYPLGDKSEQVILKLTVKVGKVKKIDYQGHPLQKTWHDKGYNTAWVPESCVMVNSGSQENCLCNPKRIKVVAVVKAPREEQQFLRELVKEYRK